jgi:hypothetical protein
MKLSQLKANPKNPRIIRDDKFKKLVASIEGFPEMMEKRPMVCVTDVDGKLFPLGGNMRLRAIQELGMKEIPDSWVTLADDWTQEKRAEFTIKDNASFGEWNYDDLANEWDAEQLSDWGVDVPSVDGEDEEKYTSKIETPVYEPKKEKPNHSQLYDDSKAKELIDEINQSDISAEDKAFLILAAKRHVVFNFEEVAEFYAHSGDEVQRLMERSAMVIIDFNQAIENGFVELSQEIQDNFMQDYEE